MAMLNNQMVCFAALPPKVLLNMSVGIPPDKGRFLSWTPYVIMTFFHRRSIVHHPYVLKQHLRSCLQFLP